MKSSVWNSLVQSKPRLKVLASWLCLAGCYLAVCFFIDERIDILLNSDMSSDMVLSQLLAEEKSVLSEQWYYSTELRVFNMQLVFAPMFWLFGDWHVIRVLGSAICYLIYLASYYYLCCQIGLKKRFAASAVFLLLPLFSDYFSVVIVGLHYIFYVTTTFLTLGMVFHYINSSKKTTRIGLLVGMGALALVAGMGGPRQMLVLYVPLGIAAALTVPKSFSSGRNRQSNQYAIVSPALKTKLKRFMLCSFLSIVLAAVGYVINSRVLSQIYSFQSWDSLSLVVPSFESLQVVLGGFLQALGYSAGSFLSFSTISNLMCAAIVLLIIASTARAFKRRNEDPIEHYLLATTFVASIVAFVLLYLFTNMTFKARYCVPVLIVAIPLVAIAVKDWLRTVAYGRVIGSVLVFGVAVCCVNNSLSWWRGNSPYGFDEYYGPELGAIAETLVREGYTEGYAPFWSGNVLTELSDGALEIWIWAEPDLENVDHMYEWLQAKDHTETVPEGRVFAVIPAYYAEAIPFSTCLDEEKLIYCSDDYKIYGYSSHDEFVEDAAS